MKTLLRSIIAACVLLAATTHAKSQNDAISDLKDKLEVQLNLKVESIESAPVPGLYQVMSDRSLFYVTEDGQHVIAGAVYDLDNDMYNETDNALNHYRKAGIKRFQDDAITFKSAHEKHVVTVFTDISCGYCRKLHQEIALYNQNGITVNYLAFPRHGIGSQTYKDMESIWCDSDRQTAITRAKAGEKVDAKECQTSIETQFKFAQKIGVNGSPAIVLENGQLIPGYKPSEQLTALLANM